MSTQEMKEKYTMLYDFMSSSNNPANMIAFGKVMNEMMDWLIANKSDVAEEMIEKLGAIKWNNYLTKKEADAIVAKMNPKAPWSKDAWKQAMDNIGLVTEEEPYYNSCAMWVEMNKMYSDHAQTLAKVLGKTVQEIPSETMVKAMNAMALDTLKDVDRVYNIRKYFGLL